MTQKNILNKTLILTAGVIFLLSIPLVAMQFTSEVNWSAGDFLFAFLLLFGTGFCYILMSRFGSDNLYKSGLALSLLSGLFLIWSNGAVGLIGSEDNLINLSYYAVIVLGIGGSLISGFRSAGMMYTLMGMAYVQLVITYMAILTGAHDLPHSSVTEILQVNGFFICLYLFAALLFRQSDLRSDSVPDALA